MQYILTPLPMCRAFLLFVIFVREGEGKASSSSRASDVRDIGIFICWPALHLTSLQVAGVKKINAENRVQHPEGWATAFCPEISISAVAHGEEALALAPSKELPRWRTSLCTLRQK